MRLPEPRNGAAKHQPPIDPHGVENRAPDRCGKVALDQVFEAQEIVAGAGLPFVRLGRDGPGRGFTVGGNLRTADGGGELIQPAKLAQLGSKHAVILRQTARIVSLHIDDMAVLNAHLLVIPELPPGTISGHVTRQELFRPLRARVALIHCGSHPLPGARACALRRPGRH